MLRWQKWQKRKQPLPIQKPVTTLAPSPWIQLPFPSLMQRGQGTREVLAFIIRQSSTSQKTDGDNDLLGLWTTWQRNRGSPVRGCFFLCPFLTWTITCQGSATLKTHGQVPGFREPTAFLHMVKTSTAAALAWRLRLDSRGRGGKKHDVQMHSHSRALPSLVPLCTETLKSQLVLTLHITSIVSKEKRFMELKHPQEVPPRGRRSCRW